ncbi:hypothetical protein LIER_05813 [Lithospermum erythrorhizon]|uniref:Transposase n=1 Tax=Lithospermum erythrorhizon TaxID=34254 RepID=A0AAV3P1X7_LITER
MTMLDVALTGQSRYGRILMAALQEEQQTWKISSEDEALKIEEKTYPSPTNAQMEVFHRPIKNWDLL